MILATDNQLAVLLVDDNAEFTEATGRVLERRGFVVRAAASGEAALDLLQEWTPDVVVLDLKMGGMDGIAALELIRRSHGQLPVLILTGHGAFEDALAGIQLGVGDFLRKPVDLEVLAVRLRVLATTGMRAALREPAVEDLMIPAREYRKLRCDAPLSVAIGALHDVLCPRGEDGLAAQGHRSVVVVDRDDQFIGLLQIGDVLRAGIPRFLRDSAYASFFTGMLLAHCKTLEATTVGDLVGQCVAVRPDAPLMEALSLMVSHRMVNLPVLQDAALVGVLRDRDLALEMAVFLGSRDGGG